MVMDVVTRRAWYGTQASMLPTTAACDSLDRGAMANPSKILSYLVRR
jgi:hypothetical protein